MSLSPESSTIPRSESFSRLIEAGSGRPESARSQVFNGPSQPKSIPLSFAQEQVWFLEKLHPQLNSYRFQAVLELSWGAERGCPRKESQPDREPACKFCARRSSPRNGETPRRKFDLMSHSRSLVKTCASFPRKQRQKELKRRIEEELRRPFPSRQIRRSSDGAFTRLDEQKYSLLHTEHHFVHDGWSYGVFLEELYATYAALLSGEISCESNREPMQFADFRTLAARNDQLRGLGSSARLLAQRIGGMSSATVASFGPPFGSSSEALKDAQIRHPIPEALWSRTRPGLLSRRRDTICLDTSSLPFVHPSLHGRGGFLHWHGLCQSPRTRDFTRCWAWRSTRFPSAHILKGLRHFAICCAERRTRSASHWIIRNCRLKRSSKISTRDATRTTTRFSMPLSPATIRRIPSSLTRVGDYQ